MKTCERTFYVEVHIYSPGCGEDAEILTTKTLAVPTTGTTPVDLYAELGKAAANLVLPTAELFLNELRANWTDRDSPRRDHSGPSPEAALKSARVAREACGDDHTGHLAVLADFVLARFGGG